MTVASWVEWSLRREPARRPVRRLPSPELDAAPIHVGVVMWTNPWEDDGLLRRWTVVRYEIVSSRWDVVDGSASAANLETGVTRDVVDMIGDDGDAV